MGNGLDDRPDARSHSSDRKATVFLGRQDDPPVGALGFEADEHLQNNLLLSVA